MIALGELGILKRLLLGPSRWGVWENVRRVVTANWLYFLIINEMR